MEEKQKVIAVDAGFFVGLYFPFDPHHRLAGETIREIEVDKPTFTTNNYLISEAITMILIRSKSLSLASRFAKKIYKQKKNWFIIYQVDQELQLLAYEIFKNQKKYKGEILSFTDCTLIAQAKKQKIKTILSFDGTLKQMNEEINILP